MNTPQIYIFYSESPSLHIIIFSRYKKKTPFSLARRSLPKSKSFREHKYLFSRREIFFFMNKNIFFHENNSTIMPFKHPNGKIHPIYLWFYNTFFHSKLLSIQLYIASYLTLNTNGAYQQHHTCQTPTQQQKTEIYLQGRTNIKPKPY